MRIGAVLHVYKGEWGLPSIDFECLRVLVSVQAFAPSLVVLSEKISHLRKSLAGTNVSGTSLVKQIPKAVRRPASPRIFSRQRCLKCHGEKDVKACEKPVTQKIFSCLVKFTRCPVKIESNCNPLNSGAGKLPYLEIGNEKFVGYREIKKLLDKEGYPVDAKLNAREKHLSESFSNWVFSNLHAYYHYFMFGEPNNFEITRSIYAKRTPFPFNFYYPSSYQKEAFDIVYVMGGFDLDDKLELHEGENLTSSAKKCINVLSRRLGRNVWFFRDQFSELDVIVFSYLSILSKITLPNNPIQNHIKGCQNLVHFINRISRDVFKKESFNSENTSRDDASPNKTVVTASVQKFLESENKTKILAGITAVVAMSTFAAINFFSKNSRLPYNGLSYEEDDEFEEDEMD